jgi:hypothetical protein
VDLVVLQEPAKSDIHHHFARSRTVNLHDGAEDDWP